jgi:hypothetical protein
VAGGNLERLARSLADTRQRAIAARAAADQARARWASEHASLLAEEQEATRLVAVLEAEVREEACKAYATTGNKQPAQGVSIALTKKVTYQSETVLRWALAKGLCLTLDAKAFEALARKNVPRDDAGVPLAVVEEVPQARISSSLGSSSAVAAPAAAGAYEVPSSTQPGVVYQVTVAEDGLRSCTCPGYAARATCKHLTMPLRAVRPC